MQAELAGLDSSVERWRFTGGCALAIVSRSAPGPLISLAGPIGLVLATVVLTAETAYLPLRLGLIAMAFLLSLLYLAGDRAALFAPFRTGSRLAGAVRAGGALTLGILALGVVLSDRSGDGNVVDRATIGVPIFTVLIALYLIGFMSMTSPVLADSKVLMHGVALGLGTAAIWSAFAIAQRPIPLSSRSAFAILAIGVLAATVVGAMHQAPLLTALSASLVGALAIFVAAQLALAYGPANWVPSDTAALTPAARLAQSRVEAGDSYLQIILIGEIAAAIIVIVAYRKQRSQPSQPHGTDPLTNSDRRHAEPGL